MHTSSFNLYIKKMYHYNKTVFITHFFGVTTKIYNITHINLILYNTQYIRIISSIVCASGKRVCFWI